MIKKYFKTGLIVFVISLFTNNLFAQGVYFEFNPGYNFSAGGQFSSNYESTDDHTGSNYHYTSDNEVVKGVSYGKGLNLDAAFGVMMNEHFGTELVFSYLLGSIGGKTKTTDTKKDIFEDYTFEDTWKSEMYGNMFRINPAIKIDAGTESVSPYARFGLVIGFGSIQGKYVNTDEDYDAWENKKTITESVREYKYNGGVAFGYNASLGLSFGSGEGISFFGELNMINLSYAPTKGELTKYTVDGKYQLPDMTTSNKEIEFVDSYTYSSNNPPPDSEPKKELKQKLPFGSFGLNFGLRIGF